MGNYRNVLLVLVCLFAFSVKSQLVINEIMATNGSGLIETDFYNYADWVEIYNSGGASVNIGYYYLSDDKNMLSKWRMPSYNLASKGYYLIYCDGENTGRHAVFGLNTGGETIYLSNSAKQIIDSVRFSKQYPSVSYGRSENGINSWLFCSVPTAGEQNQTTTASKPAPKVVYSSLAGRIASSKNIALVGEKIKYTTNGSIPNPTSSSYANQVPVTKTTVLKTRSYKDGALPGDVYANTYFLNEHAFTLPVISLSFNNEFFWDNTIGIYTEGTNGIAGNCVNYPVNWNQPWEREAYFEYFDENGIKQISQPVGMKVSGGCSRSFGEPKSLSIYARGKYGNKDFDYSFFKEKPEIRTFKSVFIRNSGNDYNGTVIWDGMMQALFKNSIDLDCQAFQPAIVYHNGNYLGMMNIREKINEDYFFSNYAVGRDSLDFLVSMLRASGGYGWFEEQGSGQDYFDMIDFLNSNSLVDDANYNHVVSQIDLKEYINYVAVQIYMVNTDWPGNNVKLWRKSKNGKWRWVLYDTDFGFNNKPYDFEAIEFATEESGPDWPNPPWSTLLFRKLLENQNFRDEFANRILTLRNTVFNPDWCNYVVDSIAGIVDYEITYHKNKYGGSKNNWYDRLNAFKGYAASRYDFIPGYIENYFGLTGNKINITIDNDDLAEGSVSVNGSVIMNYPFSMGSYDDLSMKIQAKAAKGFTFKNWETVASVSTLYLISNGSEWKYYDQGGDYPSNWNGPAFDDSSWQQGNAQLGYGDGDESTVISYGADENNKIPTYLFRKKLNITGAANIAELQLGLVADDGAVVYINGQEVFRNNMPEGTPGFNTYTATYIGNENIFIYASIDNSMLVEGDNVIACEVHQTSGTSSDVSFDLTLSYEQVGEEGGSIFGTEALIYSDTGYNISVKPVFEPIEKTYDIYLNEVASASKLFKDDWAENSGFVEIYNAGNSEVRLEGYFISDDRTNLTRYAIPEGTVLSAKGFKVFYADAEAKQGEMHMSFKPGVNGETFYLSQKVGNVISIVDSIGFEFLVDGYSFGKYVDGTGDMQIMANITPGNKNDPEIPVIIGIEELFVANHVHIYPNPSGGEIKLAFESDYVYREKVSIDVVDISGKVVFSKKVIYNTISYIDLTNLENGIYFTRIFNENNLVKTQKIIIYK